MSGWKKRFLPGAGLGGGSSDAASTLKALNELLETKLGLGELLDIAATIGSDVPFFLHGKLCECSGRGECVVPIDDDWELPIVLLKPAFGVATPDAYKRWQASTEIPGILYRPQLCPWGEMVNDLERPVFQKYPVLADMKMWLLDQPEVHAALMSGSGSTMLAVLSSQYGGRTPRQSGKSRVRKFPLVVFRPDLVGAAGTLNPRRQPDAGLTLPRPAACPRNLSPNCSPRPSRPCW